MGTTTKCLVVLGAASALLAGCSTPVEKVTTAWKKAGQAPSEFREGATKLQAGDCSSGTVSGLDATVCFFGSADEARTGAEAGFDIIGAPVGSSVAAGKAVLIVADRRGEDPTGRRVNDVINAFKEAME